MTHKHSVRDTGAHFMIDPYSRQIKNDSANKTTIVQYDHNSERLTFEMPLQIDGHAMTLCDLIEIHYINIATDGSSQNHGTYEVDDIKAEGSNAVFTWLISQKATQLAGSLNFFIVFKCTENGKTVYRWGTEICKTLAVSAGMDNGEAVLTEYPDILAQWKAELFEAGGNAVVNVNEAAANALAAIEEAGEAKKAAVLASIPDEYEALQAQADGSTRNKAGAIVLEAEGGSVVLSDSSPYPLQGLKLFGKSTQDGTPTPDAPVKIVGVENPVVGVCGKNLIDCANINVEMSDAYYQTIATKYKPVIGETYTISMDVVTSVLPFSIDVGAGKNSYNSDLSPLQRKHFSNNGRIDFSFVWMLTEEQIASGFTQLAFRVPRYSAMTSASVSVSNIQLEFGENATACEPYIEPQTAETSHTLHGIPVSSGGNYTAENGQQWICDEIDLARGVYVQRVGVIDSYNAESVPDSYVSTTGELTVGATVLYPLATPIETPLSDAEIAAFKALHTNKPNTTILNDAGAHMAVSYVADTKLYIDNKFKEIMEGVTE